MARRGGRAVRERQVAAGRHIGEEECGTHEIGGAPRLRDELGGELAAPPRDGAHVGEQVRDGAEEKHVAPVVRALLGAVAERRAGDPRAGQHMLPERVGKDERGAGRIHRGCARRRAREEDRDREDEHGGRTPSAHGEASWPVVERRSEGVGSVE